MTNKFFSVQLVPDIINGDVSTVIGNQVPSATDKAFGSTEILFDWHAVDVPRGVNMLRSIAMYSMGEDGGNQAGDVDAYLVFAKSVDGVAPSTLGSVNASQTACFELPKHFIGVAKMIGKNYEGTMPGAFGKLFTNTGSLAGDTAEDAGFGVPLILPLEDSSGTNVGYDTLYVAGFTGSSAVFDFSTGVQPTAQATTSTDTIAVDGVDPRKCFQIGDTVYTNTDDTALGTVKSMGANEIVLNANLAAQVEDNEEIVNANPLRITLGFER